jgi:hypothetical protein
MPPADDMGVFAFIAKQNGGTWSAKAFSKEDGYKEDLTAEASSQTELERALVSLAQANSSGGGVQLSFNQITPSSAVIVVSQLPDLSDITLKLLRVVHAAEQSRTGTATQHQQQMLQPVATGRMC